MFEPSERQRTALEKMAQFAGYRKVEQAFSDKAAFDAYFDKIKKHADREAKRRDSQSLQERQQQREKRSKKHYQSLEKLTAYGQRYAQRYAPSEGKLRQRLLSKCDNEQLADEALAKLAYYINDNERIEQAISSLRYQGKSIMHIKQHLRRRLFPAGLIEQKLRKSKMKISGMTTPCADACNRHSNKGKVYVLFSKHFVITVRKKSIRLSQHGIKKTTAAVTCWR